MRIWGQFRDKNDVLIEVNIVTNGTTTPSLEIGRSNGIVFGADPVQIECNNEDTFEPVIRQRATITLNTQDYVGDQLFASNARNVKVDIIRAGKNIFSGYAEPATFSQPYVTMWDEFTINCFDALSTLEYSNYKDVTAGTYPTVHTNATLVTFQSILDDVLGDILEECGGNLYYDGSKGITAASTSTLFDDLSVSELVMLGETYDDVWTREEVLEEVLRYFNLHIVQDGNDFYIFDWDSLKDGVSTWINLSGGSDKTYTPESVPLLYTSHTTNQSDISIGEVYNQVQVTCDVMNQESVITSPLDDDALTPAFAGSGKVKYCTEYISEGEGLSAWEAFNAMVDGTETSYDGAQEVDWYAQIMKSATWNLYIGSNTQMDTLYSGYQTSLIKYVEQNRLTPLLISLGKVERDVDSRDNSLTSKIEMKNYLVMSINGSWRNEETEVESSVRPSVSDISSKNFSHGLIEYVGGNAGGAFSPVDADTTNYLVFSGEVCLMPNQWETDRFSNCVAGTVSGDDLTVGYGMYNTVPSDNNGDGRYYTRKFYINDSTSFMSSGKSLSPWTEDKSNHLLEFDYVRIGDSFSSVDNISKLPILECELIIGDKRCVEIDMDEYGNSTFVWVDKNTGVSQTYVDEYGVTQTYLKTTISLGVNPKIGDKIVGGEFDLQNTISYTMNVDAEGTGIPMRMSDHLSGRVEFRILGPINLTWEEITRRHPTFFRHTKWSANTYSVLSHTENIWIKDFECNVVSDGAGMTGSTDKDLVYVSNETDKFVETKDDVTFEFVTQLSSSEANQLGVTASCPLNAVINTSTKLGQTSIYNARTSETNKAEKHYVNQYYLAYSSPKLIYEIDVHDDSDVDWRNLYTSSVLNKTFFVMGWSRSLRLNVAHLKLKEV